MAKIHNTVFLEGNSHETVRMMNALNNAVASGRHVRIMVTDTHDGRSVMKYKVGEEMWTPPIYSEKPNAGYHE